MKLLGSLLFAAGAQGATLCTGSGTTNLISAECDETGFTITVDETCRAAAYSWIDFESGTFIDGVQTKVSVGYMDTIDSECKPVATNGEWVYTVAFTQCNLADAVKGVVDTSTGIAWHTYSLYLNYDRTLSQPGWNLQQLDQTLIQCRIPANLQENAIPGDITITDADDLVPDESSDIDLWDELQLDVISGGNAKDASWATENLATGAEVELGEHIKLKINDKTGSSATTDYNIAIKDCWASTVENEHADGEGAIDFDPTGANIGGVVNAHKTVKFLKDQCPVFSWVKSSLTGSTVFSNLETSLRQFAFNDGDSTTFSNGFFYHCEIDICMKTAGTPTSDDDSDCVTAQTYNDCITNAPTSFSPTGRRRRAIVSSKRVERSPASPAPGSQRPQAITSSKRVTRETSTPGDGDSATFTLNFDNCAETQTVDGITICLAQKKSSAQAATLSVLTGVLFCALH